MSKRNPNDPIPGFDEYTGTVGREKKFHKTHFTVPELPWKRTPVSRDPNYIRVGPGRYKYVGRKRIRAGDMPEVQ